MTNCMMEDYFYASYILLLNYIVVWYEPPSLSNSLLTLVFFFPLLVRASIFCGLTSSARPRAQSDRDGCYTTPNRCKTVGLRQSNKIFSNMKIYPIISITCFYFYKGN